MDFPRTRTAAYTLTFGRRRENHRAELAIIWAIIITVIWIIIGWRAMRAHEKIAHELSRYIKSELAQEMHNWRRENAAQHKDYRNFIMEHPEVEQMPAKERHELFREWLGKLQGEGDGGV